MLLGLLADIHEKSNFLAAALRHFHHQSVDQVVVLGDIFDTGRRLDSVIRLLEEAGAVGVWGNHELGLCHEPEPEFLAKFPVATTQFFARLRPRWEVERYLATHALPTIDPTNPLDYYSSSIRPQEEAARAACFAKYSNRVLLMGHYHCWFAATPEQVLSWQGEGPLNLSASPSWIIVVHAVMHGWCAVLDTQREVLTPCKLSASRNGSNV